MKLTHIVPLLLLVSCAASDGMEKHTVANQGYLCANAPAFPASCEAVSFVSGQKLVLSVDFGICLSGSCNALGATSCQVTRSGNVLEVSAEGSYTTDTRAQKCTADCRLLTASCESEPLPDGDYEIHYAGQTLSLSVPSTKSRVCMGNGGFVACCDSNADCSGATCSASHTCAKP